MRALLLVSLLSAPALAQPDLSRQNAWTEKEKKAFIEFLRSGSGAAMPGGSVKSVALPPDEGVTTVRKAAYLTAGFAGEALFTVAGNGSVLREGSGLGPRVLYGSHLFSWVRWYAGAQGNRFLQSKHDGTRESVTHLQFPVGIELALVPLGTPQTRYLVLRGGVAGHFFEASSPREEFRTPLLGPQGSWNVGLGYEWQVPESNWRLHAAADGYHSLIRRSSSARFFGVGLSGGLTYTF